VAPIVFRGNGDPGGNSKLGRLTDETGIFPSMYESFPDPMTEERPPGELGPYFVISWRVPGEGQAVVIKQKLYPYADAGPYTFVAAGQKTAEAGYPTTGGWFRAPDGLVAMLQAEGLPTRAEIPALPSSGDAAATGTAGTAAASDTWSTVLSLGLLGLILALLAGVLLKMRPQKGVAS
jgi:hypothetical protein